MDDLISRQTILKWIDECLNHSDKLWEYEEKALIGVKQYIKHLPSAQPKHNQNAPSKQPDLETLGVKTGETCADAISRQAAIDVMCELMHHWFGGNPKDEIREIKRELEKLPSAQPEPSQVARDIATIIENEKDMRVVLQQPRWIPCSERLPEEYGNYLVSIRGEEPDIGTINPEDERGWSLCDATGFYWAREKKLDVLAWMPLPEPFKKEGEVQC